jgi:hypothetical protein
MPAEFALKHACWFVWSDIGGMRDEDMEHALEMLQSSSWTQSLQGQCCNVVRNVCVDWDYLLLLGIML